MMSCLRLELITKILSRLPVKSLVRLLSVTKQWYSFIKDPDFVKLHLKHSIETNKDQAFIPKEHDFYPTDRYFSRSLSSTRIMGLARLCKFPCHYAIQITKPISWTTVTVWFVFTFEI